MHSKEPAVTRLAPLQEGRKELLRLLLTLRTKSAESGAKKLHQIIGELRGPLLSQFSGTAVHFANIAFASLETRHDVLWSTDPVLIDEFIPFR